MKIVFLDFDGVLNSGKYFASLVAKPGDRVVLADDNNHFDPKAVSLLNEITDRTGALIVVSSSWRYGRTVQELRTLLTGVGVTGYVTNKTPTIGEPRGLEIAEWLSRPTVHVENYVILDDTDIGQVYPARRHFIQTDVETGLTRAHVEAACKRLGEIVAA